MRNEYNKKSDEEKSKLDNKYKTDEEKSIGNVIKKRSFLQKIKDDYNNGKISFNEFKKLRKAYKISTDEEKLAISKDYKTYNYTFKRPKGLKGYGYLIAIISTIIYLLIVTDLASDISFELRHDNYYSAIKVFLILFFLESIRPIVISLIISYFKSDNYAFERILVFVTVLSQLFTIAIVGPS